MRLLDKIRKVFDTGGVVVELETPKSFSWDDPTIPVQVKVTGHGSEVRQLQQLGFSLKDSPGRPRGGSGEATVDVACRHLRQVHEAAQRIDQSQLLRGIHR